MEEFIKKCLASKAMYQARISGADPVKGVIGSDLLRAIIIGMLPPKGHEDIAKHRHLWKAVDELERYLISLIHDRSRIKGGDRSLVDACGHRRSRRDRGSGGLGDR